MKKRLDAKSHISREHQNNVKQVMTQKKKDPKSIIVYTPTTKWYNESPRSQKLSKYKILL